MFSGLVKTTTKVKDIRYIGAEFNLVLAIPNDWTTEIEIGQSIAVNGVCLSVVQFNDREMVFYVMQQTIEKTNFGELRIGDSVNLEPPLRLNDYLNGHFVLGHVDGTVQCLKKEQREGSCQLEFEKPSWLDKFLYERTSICLNGVSLTVSHVWENRFAVNLVPLTQTKTNLMCWDKSFNVEIDHFSKMVENLFELRK